MASSSEREKTLPTGLWGELRTSILVLAVMAASSSDMLIVQFAAEEVRVAPSLGGSRGTYFMVPPDISMLEMYWSKKGSKIMTSSPGSMKPMNALSMPKQESDVGEERRGLGIQGKRWRTPKHTHVVMLEERLSPSLAPVVIVTSVSGSSFLPKNGE